MKVTQVLYSGKGGHGSVAHSIVRADRDNSFQHALIYFGIEEMDSDYIAFCESKKIDFKAIQKTEGKHLSSWINYLKALRSQKPDRIILHSMTLILPAIWYCIFHKTKLVAVEHQSNQFKRKSEWWWSFFALLFAKKVVYLSETYKQEILRKIGFFVAKRKISIIPNGIDTNYFRPEKSNSKNVLRIGMASRINDLRDHKTLIQAFERLAESRSNIELHIAGDGDGMEKLEKIVENSPEKDSIFLHGNLNEAQLLTFFQRLDIYVHSTFAETMSTSVIQAMGVGLPVIVSKIPGTLSLFEDKKEGFFFMSQNTSDLLEKIDFLLDDELLSTQIGAKAREKCISTYHFETMFEKYQHLLRTI